MAENKAIMPMADYTAICDAVRAKKGTADTYKSGELATAISSIEGGGGSSRSGLYTGHIDSAGLLAIGWEQPYIDWLQERVFWNEEDDDKWTVAATGQDKWLWKVSSMPANTKTIAMVVSGSNVGLGTTSFCYFLKSYDGCTIKSFPRYLNAVSFVDLSNAEFTTSVDMSFLYNSSVEELLMPKELANTKVTYKNCNCLHKINLKDLTISQTDFANFFYNCYNIKIVDLGDIDTSNATSFQYAFYNCKMLHEISGVIDLDSATNVSNAFYQCNSLVSVKIKNLGISIAINNFCLSKESILYLFSNAKSVTSGTITLGATNLAKLTDDEKAIATNKGWTLA